jgi:gliding motility-associated protein GldE
VKTLIFFFLEETESFLYHTATIIEIFKPFTTGALIASLLIVLLLFGSAMISGSETAFFSLDHKNIRDLRIQKGRINELIIHLLEKPKQLLATILIANNFINVAIVMVSAYVTMSVFDFSEFPVLAILIQVVVITSLLLIFGEIVPKMLASKKPVAFARRMAVIMNVLNKMFYQLSMLLVHSTDFIDKRFANKATEISMNDLSNAIDIASNEEQEGKEKKILKGIVNFRDIMVREIMRSRVDVTALDVETAFKDVIAIVVQSGYSRIPVYRDNFDSIVGVLYIKDLLPHLGHDDFQWTSLLREPYYVPENKPVKDLLQEFQDEKIHLAIVVDEYGGTSGIVTFEDVIEEIIGEITDEFDTVKDDIDYKKIDDKTYVFEAKTALNDFCKIIELNNDYFDDVKGESDSLAGLILENQGEIPPKGKKIKIKAFTFTILDVDNRRIKRVKIQIDDESIFENY